MVYPVRLLGERTVLREFTADDLDAVHAIIGDDRVTRWLSFDSRSRDQAEQMLTGVLDRAQAESRSEYYLGVTQLDSDTLVGFVRLATSGVQAGKLGYAVNADYWRRGYARDAARTMTSFGFRQLGLHRISAAVGPDNTTSTNLLKALGFAYEGRLRDHVYTNGAWRDSLLYAALDYEWVDGAEALV
jgi:RimJ/RimL family protein N-acetyltransferase